nr:hypothetical protein [uncultured Draconibacterium sp.]
MEEEDKSKTPGNAGRFCFYNTNCFSFFLVINASRKTFTTFLSASGSFSMLLNWFRSSLSVKELSARSSEVPFVR